MSKKNIIYLSASLLALVLGVALYVFMKPRSEAEAEEPVNVVAPGHLRVALAAAANLKTTAAELQDFPETLSVTGKISPTEDRTYVVPARTAGRIEQVLISSGEAVTALQPLAKMWSPDYIAAKEEFIQSLREDQTLLSTGQKPSDNDFEGLSRLARKKLESMGLLNVDIERLEKLAKAGTADDDQSDRFLVVRAPRAGVVLLKNATLGNSVNLGDALFTIADLKEVWFLGDLYPEDLSKVQKNQKVLIEGPTPGQSLSGKVSFISPIVDSSSRTIKIRALMSNPSLTMRGDMYVQGHLVLTERKAIVIPTPSLLREQDESFVFKILPPITIDGRSVGLDAVKTKVSVLGEKEGRVAIAEGLMPGDQVVSDGAILLNAVLTANQK